MLKGGLPRKAAMKLLKDLCNETGMNEELIKFYLLYFAISDLEQQGVQWYWKGADRSNIEQIVDDFSKAWLAAHDTNTCSSE
jgi:hypothetical protein